MSLYGDLVLACTHERTVRRQGKIMLVRKKFVFDLPQSVHDVDISKISEMIENCFGVGKDLLQYEFDSKKPYASLNL
jgi:hypothetical protein